MCNVCMLTHLLLQDRLPFLNDLLISSFEVVDSVAARLAAALLDDCYDVRTIWSVNHLLFEACCDTRVAYVGQRCTVHY